MAAEIVARGGKGLCSPSFDGDGRLLCCSPLDGRILVLEPEGFAVFSSTDGAPVAILANHLNELVCLDQAQSAALVLLADGSQQILADSYEGASLKGPSAAAFSADGQLYICDSGPLGETGLASPKGSVFVITSERILRPLALECLAYPSAIALSPSETAVFVAEQCANRIVRYVQKPANVWHGVVWHSFTGRMGPTALVADHGRNLLYVARSELPEHSDKGIVSVMDLSEGKLLKDIVVPGPEVTGLALSPDGKALYVTEATTNSLSKIVL